MALGENLSRARSSDDVSSVRHEVSELRAEMARLRQSTSFQIPPAAHGGILMNSRQCHLQSTLGDDRWSGDFGHALAFVIITPVHYYRCASSNRTHVSCSELLGLDC